MKRLLASGVLVVLLALAGCDTEAPPPQDTGGEVSFLLDGQEWAVGANVSSVYTEGYGYGILTGWPAPGDSRLRQVLLLALPDLSERAYPLADYQTGGEGYGTTISEEDGDAPLANYESIGDGDSLVVTRYDPATGEIEATFEGTFATAPNPRLPRTLPDTFEVTRGVVRATLWNPPENM